MDPHLKNAYLNSGLLNYKLRNFNKAVDDFTNAIAIDSNYYNAWYNSGLAKYKLADYTGAIADLTRAIEIRPRSAIGLV